MVEHVISHLNLCVCVCVLADRTPPNAKSRPHLIPYRQTQATAERTTDRPDSVRNAEVFHECL